MKITRRGDPEQLVGREKFWRDFEAGKLHTPDSLVNHIGGPLCARLIMNPYGEHDGDYAGHFEVIITDIKYPKKPWPRLPSYGVDLTLVAANLTDKVAVRSDGLLVATRRFSLQRELGYFPKENKRSLDEVLQGVLPAPWSNPNQPLYPV
jgi:hypothetical protein